MYTYIVYAYVHVDALAHVHLYVHMYKMQKLPTQRANSTVYRPHQNRSYPYQHRIAMPFYNSVIRLDQLKTDVLGLYYLALHIHVYIQGCDTCSE